MYQFLTAPTSSKASKEFYIADRSPGALNCFFLQPISIIYWILITAEFAIENWAVGGVLLALQVLRCVTLLAGSEFTTLNYFQNPRFLFYNFTFGIVILVLSVGLVLIFSAVAGGTEMIPSVNAVVDFCVVVIVVAVPFWADIATLAVLRSTAKILSHRHKLIITSFQSLVKIAEIDVLVSDMCGTITRNIQQLDVDETSAVNLLIKEARINKVDQIKTLIGFGILTCKFHTPATDAITKMFLDAIPASGNIQSDFVQIKHRPFDPRTKRTVSRIHSMNAPSAVFDITMGNAEIILSICREQAGDFADRVKKVVNTLTVRGVRCIAFAKRNAALSLWSEEIKLDEAQGWEFIGLVSFRDPVYATSKQAVRKAELHGIEVKMVTGHIGSVARNNAKEIGLLPNSETTIARRGNGNDNDDDETNERTALLIQNTDAREAEEELILTYSDIPRFPESGDPRAVDDTLLDPQESILRAKVFHNVYAEHKFMITSALQQHGRRVAITGDGVGDCVAMKKAHVGISVHGGTDATRQCCDFVMTEPSLKLIVDGVVVARNAIIEKLFDRGYFMWKACSSISLNLVYLLVSTVYYCVRIRENNHNNNEDIVRQELMPLHFPVLMYVVMMCCTELFVIGSLTVADSDDDDDDEEEQENGKKLFLLRTMLVYICFSVASSALLLLAMMCELDHRNDPDSSAPFIVVAFETLGMPKRLSFGQIVVSLFLKTSISDVSMMASLRTSSRRQRRGCSLSKFNAAIIISSSIILSIVVANFGWNNEVGFSNKNNINSTISSCQEGCWNQMQGLWYNADSNSNDETEKRRLFWLFISVYCGVWFLIQELFLACLTKINQ